MFRLVTGCVAVAAAATAAPAQLAPLGGPTKEPAWYAAAVKSVTATFDPPAAKPGQTVTFRLTVELNPGYVTYPVKQADQAAAGFTNRLQYPGPGAVVFVGDTIDPPKLKTKADSTLGITEMRYATDTVVYERKAVVSPTAAAGPTAVKMTSFQLSVCQDEQCYPPRKLTPEAKLDVLPGPAVPLDPAFAAEVKKATGL